MKNYILQNLIAIDQLANTLLAGYADETLSSRAWRAEVKGTLFGKIFRPSIDALFFIFEKDHCYKSYLSEIKRKQYPTYFRRKYSNE